jgi:hypothetical protein
MRQMAVPDSTSNMASTQVKPIARRDPIFRFFMAESRLDWGPAGDGIDY